tara:strand:+ start:8248 stop:8940 length:693 start_codon:yes stop_codon:yes gene_type:complete
MKKLTEDQIQKLYKFTRAHFVYHYDLQTELVDHMANGIENLQEQNTNLTFQQALDKEFEKFGVFGFQNVVENRQKVLFKKYWRIILHFYQEYFTLPKVLFTLILSALLFTILKLSPTAYQHYILIGIFGLFLIPSTIKILKYRQILKKKKQKWMLEEMLLNQMGIFNIILLPIQLANIRFEIENLYILSMVCIFSISLLLLYYIMVFVIPPKAEELLSETYPEYKMMQTL